MARSHLDWVVGHESFSSDYLHLGWKLRLALVLDKEWIVWLDDGLSVSWLQDHAAFRNWFRSSRSNSQVGSFIVDGGGSGALDAFLLFGLNSLGLLLPKDHWDAAFEGALDIRDIEGADGDTGFVGLILVELRWNFPLCLQGISQDLSPNPVEGLEEGLWVEVLCGGEESVDVSGDDIEKGFHAILIVQASLLLICLHFPQQLFLLVVEEAVHEVQGIMSSLEDGFWNLLAFGLDGFDDEILRKGRNTILDFSCSKAEMRERMLSCILL